MDYEKRVLEGFQMQEETMLMKIYNLLEKRDTQDRKIEQIHLINENLCAKIQENTEKLEKVNFKYREMKSQVKHLQSSKLPEIDFTKFVTEQEQAINLL